MPSHWNKSKGSFASEYNILDALRIESNSLQLWMKCIKRFKKTLAFTKMYWKFWAVLIWKLLERWTETDSKKFSKFKLKLFKRVIFKKIVTFSKIFLFNVLAFIRIKFQHKSTNFYCKHKFSFHNSSVQSFIFHFQVECKFFHSCACLFKFFSLMIHVNINCEKMIINL